MRLTKKNNSKTGPVLPRGSGGMLLNLAKGNVVLAIESLARFGTMNRWIERVIIILLALEGTTTTDISSLFSCIYFIGLSICVHHSVGLHVHPEQALCVCYHTGLYVF